MNIRYLVLILSTIILMGCSSDDSSTPAAAADTNSCPTGQTRNANGDCEADGFTAINLDDADDNIQDRIDDGDNTVKQGGEGQIIAIVSDAFSTTHKEFYDSATNETKFTSIFDINYSSPSSYGRSFTETGHIDGTDSVITDTNIFHAEGGNCIYNSSLSFGDSGFCHEDGIGTSLAGIIAGNKDDSGIYGVAYNAQLKGISLDRYNGAADFDYTLAQREAIIEAGSGADIAVMQNSWGGKQILLV